MKESIQFSVKKLALAIGVGIVITLAGWLVTGINLKLRSGIEVNPNVAAYFETCHGSSFNVTAPLIKFEDRGFPVAFVSRQDIPLCGQDRITIDRSVKESSTNYAVVLFNTAFWSLTAYYLVISKFKKAPASKQESEA